MAYEDKMITCEDCGTEFAHSATDQARYAERGFTSDPKRCRECRAARKARGGGGGGSSGGRGGGGPRHDRGDGGRGARESFDAVCASCGAQTTVPFKPTQNRPVYCRDCYRSMRQ